MSSLLNSQLQTAMSAGIRLTLTPGSETTTICVFTENRFQTRAQVYTTEFRMGNHKPQGDCQGN